MRKTPGEKLPIALFGALALHLGGVMLARVYAPSPEPGEKIAEPPPGSEVDAIEVDFDTDVEPEAAATTRITAAAPRGPKVATSAGRAMGTNPAPGEVVVGEVEGGDLVAAPEPSAADASGDPWGDASSVDWSDPAAEAGGWAGWGLSLPDRIALAPESAPAPTRPRAPRPLTEDSIEGGIRSAMRARDESIGLGGQEATIVTTAVKLAARAAPVPSGTRARFEIDLDAAGNILGARIAQFSHGNERIWGDVLAAFKGALGPGPIALGGDAKKAGVRLQIDAQIVHALPGGSVDGVRVGECMPMPEEGGDRGTTRDMFSGSDFFAVGGGLYGDRATGTCTFGEDPTAERHIEVRTTTRSVFPNAGPPPAHTMPKPKKLLPWVLP